MASRRPADAAAVLGRDGVHLLEPERVELGERDVRLGRGALSTLFTATKSGFPDAAQQIRDGPVDARQPLASVHDEHDGGGLVHGELRLLADLGHEPVARLGLEPAGVDDGEGAAVPVDVGVVPIAGDAGDVLRRSRRGGRRAG